MPRRSAPAVTALEAEGAIVVAKANADEFAWGVTGQNPHYGDVVNPLASGRISGGSSAGNAAALAAGVVPLALGTDTGGSVRMPAAACGVVGFKPPVGTVSVAGVHPLAPSFDTVGPMARSVGDCALAYSVLTGEPVPPPAIAGLRVGRADPASRYHGRGRPTTSPTGAPPNWRSGCGPGAPGSARFELPVPAADTWPVFYAEAAAAHAATFPSRRG